MRLIRVTTNYTNASNTSLIRFTTNYANTPNTSLIRFTTNYTNAPICALYVLLRITLMPRIWAYTCYLSHVLARRGGFSLTEDIPFSHRGYFFLSQNSQI